MFALFRLPKFSPGVNSRIDVKNFGSLQSTAKIVRWMIVGTGGQTVKR
jgi:hypothetical protein